MTALISFVLLAVGGYEPSRRALAFAPAAPPDPEKSLQKARADKYAMLLHQIKVEKDGEEYGEFKDLGYRNRAEYAGHKNLSAGWWVYVQPYWYVWGERTDRAKKPKRPYGPEQVLGEPDAVGGGDSPNAWCPSTADGQDEWLLLEYDEMIIPTAVVIHENYGPGAVNKIGVFKADGTEVEAWKGDDPTAATAGSGVSEIELKIDFKTNRIKVYIDSKNVAGWQEIDAVGLRDVDKKTHWAAHAAASSTYAQNAPGEERMAEYEERISSLEDELQQLRKTVEDLKKQLKKEK
jgi:hypothetical protein